LNHPLRKQPPFGSTDWAAQQFRRLLDREQREKAHLRELQAAGWRPRLKPDAAGDRNPVLGDGREALVKLIQADLDHRKALAREARRRANARPAQPSPAAQQPGTTLSAERLEEAQTPTYSASQTHPFSGWSHDDVAKLGQAERLERLRLLSRISPNRAIYPGLGQEMNAGLDVPEDLTQFEQALRQRFYDSAVTDPVISHAEANWAKLSPAERQRAVERVAALQGEIFGFDPVPIEFEEMPGQFGGRYDRNRNVIVLNSKPSEGRHTIFNAAHEAGHVFQRRLREDFRAGRIAPDDPRYPLAEALSLVDPYYIRPNDDRVKRRPEENLERYEKQPSEKHANQYWSGLYAAFAEQFR